MASSENARDWKKCSVSSVLKSPTLSRLNLALNLIQGLPDKSKAHYGAAFIHRRHKAEASDAAFVTKGLF